MWKTTSILIGCVLILITLGIIMLASTSGVQGELRHHDSLYFVKRQLVWLTLALMAGAIATRIPYHFWRKVAIPLSLVSFALLTMVLMPGIGSTVKGSARWLKVWKISIQPSEIAKLTTIFVLAWWMAKNQRKAGTFIRGHVIPLIFLGTTLLLIFIEPDFGTTMLIAVVGIMIMFIGGTRIGYLAITSSMGLVAFVIAVMHNEVRFRRIIAFMDPFEYAEKEAFQLLNAIYAFVGGGWNGVGLGNSMQKKFYLPEAHTDFIFAIIGEELGLVTLGIVLLYVTIFVCGTLISLKAQDMFGRLLGFGICLMLSLQAAINIGVVTGSLPTKGLALPFISFGGSSLIICCVMVGVLVNVAMHSGEPVLDEES